MGRYYGIINNTRNESVSDYWKSDSFCDAHAVMHQLHWESTDKISSACYDSYCEFEYYADENIMLCVDKTIEKLQSDDIEELKEEETDLPSKTYGFDTTLRENADINHVPDWNGNTCKHCGYQYDSTKLPEYENKFSDVFFMN